MSKGRILIADDTATFRTILGDGLADKGYDVIYASDGLETITMVREGFSEIRLVVLDLLMPKMLGFDVLKEIREMEGGKDLPVMVITGLFKNLEDIKKVKDLGASGFIDKSLSMEDIIFRIAGFLDPDEHEEKKVVEVPVSIAVNYKHEGNAFSAYTFTVSPKGMFLRTSKPLEEGAETELQFELNEGGRNIKTKARVTRVVTADDREALLKSPKGMEVEFVGLDPGDKSHLKDWLEKLAAEKDNQ